MIFHVNTNSLSKNSKTTFKVYQKGHNQNFKNNTSNSTFEKDFLTNNFINKNQNFTQERESYELALGPCFSEFNCFFPYGICLNSTACLCLPEYANIIENRENFMKENIKCFYRKKKLILAGLLELFLPFSLGHFYVSNYKLGFMKLIYNLIVYSLCFVLVGKTNDVLQSTVFMCLILSCLIPVWNLIDMFLFFTGYYKDGYGVALY